MFKLMDVTLREGSYVVNNALTKSESKKLVHELNKAKIDLIEIGYLGNISKDSGVEKCDSEYLDFLTDGEILKWEGKFSVMINPEKFSQSTAEILADRRIGMVRLTVTKRNLERVKEIINSLSKYNITISTNLIRVSRLGHKELNELVNELVDTNTDIIYLADSNGALLPEDIKNMFFSLKHLIMKKRGKQRLGFHAHNNLGMAIPNALAAIEVGCDFIDASILGYGKSSGNLSLEWLSSLMRRQNFIYKWNITKILSLANQLTTVVRKSGFYLSQPEGAIIGMKNINLDEVQEIYKVKDISSLLDEENK